MLNQPTNLSFRRHPFGHPLALRALAAVCTWPAALPAGRRGRCGGVVHAALAENLQNLRFGLRATVRALALAMLLVLALSKSETVGVGVGVGNGAGGFARWALHGRVQSIELRGEGGLRKASAAFAQTTPAAAPSCRRSATAPSTSPLRASASAAPSKKSRDAKKKQTTKTKQTQPRTHTRTRTCPASVNERTTKDEGPAWEWSDDVIASSFCARRAALVVVVVVVDV